MLVLGTVLGGSMGRPQPRWRLILAVPGSLLVSDRLVDQARVFIGAQVLRVKVSLDLEVPPELRVLAGLKLT